MATQQNNAFNTIVKDTPTGHLSKFHVKENVKYDSKKDVIKSFVIRDQWNINPTFIFSIIYLL